MIEKIKRFFGLGEGSFLVALYMVFAAALVTSNVLACKLVTTGIPWFGTGNNYITFNAGTFCYALTLLVSNIISYRYGKDKAARTIVGGFAAQIVSTLLIVAMQYFPAAASDATGITFTYTLFGVELTSNAYSMILGQNWIIVIASLTAFLLCQIANWYIFNKLNAKFEERRGASGVCNIISTISGQLLDTVVFDFIAFGLGGYAGVAGGLYTISSNPVGLLGMMLGTWLFKVIISLVYTGIFYLLATKKNKVAISVETK